MISGVVLVTAIFTIPIRSIFDNKIFTRFESISFDNKKPLSPNAWAIWVLLEPGAAHKSNTMSSGCTFIISTGAEALGSCR